METTNRSSNPESHSQNQASYAPSQEDPTEPTPTWLGPSLTVPHCSCACGLGLSYTQCHGLLSLRVGSANIHCSEQQHVGS